jgi:hypothetical protein
VGILLLMMSLAGQVFNLTVQSTGQATALTDVMQELRAFEQTLREDLRGVQPGASLLLIQGNPVNAYWTREGREADADGNPAAGGYPHPTDSNREDPLGNMVAPRADILMFFTARRGTSFVDAGVTSNLQQVVYGHAELGEYVASETDPLGYTFEPGQMGFPTAPLAGPMYPSVTEISQVPAQDWHLARRSVLLLPTDPPTPLTPPVTRLDDASSKRLLEGQTDVISFRNMPGPKDVPYNGYDDLVLRPQFDPATLALVGEPWFLPAVFGNVSESYGHAQRVHPFARSKLDMTPPPRLANRLGHYLLPNCASFKVEWTLNPRSEFVAGRLDGSGEVLWFDPGDGDPTKPDPLRSLANRVNDLKKGNADCPPTDALCESLRSLLEDRSFHGDCLDASCTPIAYSLADRFRGADGPDFDSDYGWPQLAPDGKRANLVVFTATRPSVTGGEPAPDDMFPGALRITIDVFDKDRRLDRPIRHVMVIPVGG